MLIIVLVCLHLVSVESMFILIFKSGGSGYLAPLNNLCEQGRSILSMEDSRTVSAHLHESTVVEKNWHSVSINPWFTSVALRMEILLALL